MPFWTLAFLAGITSLTFLRQLPPVYVSWAILPVGLLLHLLLPQGVLRWLKLPIAGALGFAWALLAAQHLMSWGLPEILAGTNVTVVGTVATIPERKGNNLSFEMEVKRMLVEGYVANKPVRVRLSWYHSPIQLQVGDEWQLVVRLKQPRGFWNPASFDYQAWLLEHRVRATGYVVAKGDNRLLASDQLVQVVNRVRERLARGIVESLHAQPLVGLVTALAVGVRDNITEQQWAVLRGTGTNHLFAIAGLHIGFVSGMIYALVNFIWRRLGRLPLYFATPQAAALGALITAVLYSALAGFAMPTQRAIIMIAVFLLATLLRKNLPPWTAWSLALLIILIREPLAVLSDSFWLSFGAVALIIYGAGGRLNQSGWWWRWGHIQWVIAVGLIPLSLLFFHQASLAGFIANAIAIPWVGFITLPLSLLGSVCWLWFPVLGAGIWQCAEWSLAIIWPILAYLASIDWVQWITYITNPWIFLSSLLAVVLLLAPRGFPARWLGFVWALPLLTWTPPGPKTGEIWLTQFDVGRGLAAMVRTAHHVLIYDTGPRFNSDFNVSEAVIIPTLRSAGIKIIDKLMISSGDNNHIGGAAALLSQIPTQAVITRVPLFFQSDLATVCQIGQSWQWDGVTFQVLDTACSLSVFNGSHRIVLLSNNRIDYAHYNAGIVATRGTVISGINTYTTATEGMIIIKGKVQQPLLLETYYRNWRHFWDT